MEAVSGGPPQWRQYVVSLSAPSGTIERFDPSIKGLQQHLMVNDKLRRGYALMMGGGIKVFSTDTDTLVSTSQKPSCVLQVLAINQVTDTVYGGGATAEGACLVQFDADGHVVRENVVGPTVEGTKASAGKLLRTDKVRADTTVVEADVA
jgi:hypothetical protein